MKGPVPAELEHPLKLVPAESVKVPEPFSEDVWKTWLSFLSYTKAPLDARTEMADDASPDYRLEKISFTAAYGGERMLAYLFLPKKGRPPTRPWSSGPEAPRSASDRARTAAA